MKKALSFLINRHQDIFKILLSIAAIAIVIYVFPKTGKFKYQYETGRPWKHENLIAPFDFAIQKSEEELSKEREAITKEIVPHYRIDQQIFDKEKTKFTALFNSRVKRFNKDTTQNFSIDSALHLEFGLGLLEKLYSEGIVQFIPEHEGLPTESHIVILRENIAGKRKVSELKDLQKSLIYMEKELEINPEYFSALLMPILESSLKFNAFHDDSTMLKLQKEKIENISLTRGLVKKGETIVRKGDIVTLESFQKLLSLDEEFEKRVVGLKQANVITLGYLCLIIIVALIFSSYVYYYQKDVRQSVRKVFFVLMLIVAMVCLVAVVVKRDLPVLYAIPFCIVPIILRTFFSSTLALYVHLVVVLISGFLIPYGYGFVFMQITAGIVAIIGNVRARYLTQFFKSCALILLTYVAAYTGVSLIQEGTFNIDFYVLPWLVANVFLTLLAFPLIPIFEKFFGFVSEITLVELSDLNKPLLKKLSIETPGTFQHSLQVANLGEAAAGEIGANPLLIKVGALYHDIGKMEKPVFFIENQNAGANPHDDLPPEESAKIIINHVKSGIELGKKHRLPDVLLDFIRTHHGTTRVEYFYQRFLQLNPDTTIEVEEFTYPGPIPYSKETAVLMMADTVEAASRSLKLPTSENISELVETLIDNQVAQKQFSNANITFKDISVCKKVFKKLLNSIYHVRIEYPSSR